jgi:hypothetical protein
MQLKQWASGVLARLVLPLVLLVPVAVAVAVAVEGQTCSNPGVVIMFFNGVWNSLGDASASLAELRSKTGETAVNGAPIDYVLMFNPSQGKTADLLEAYRQKTREVAAVTPINPATSAFMASALYFSPPEIDPATRVFFNPLELGLFDALNALTASMLEQSLLEAMTLPHQESSVVDKFVATAITKLNQNYRLLFVAHSQGNLFANDVYRLVTSALPSTMIRAVNIATPASATTTPDSPWVTYENDIVIKAVTIKFPSTMPALTKAANPNRCSSADKSGHEFVKVYLNVDCVGATVSTAILRALTELEPSGAYDARCRDTSCQLKVPSSIEGVFPSSNGNLVTTVGTFKITFDTHVGQCFTESPAASIRDVKAHGNFDYLGNAFSVGTDLPNEGFNDSSITGLCLIAALRDADNHSIIVVNFGGCDEMVGARYQLPFGSGFKDYGVFYGAITHYSYP